MNIKSTANKKHYVFRWKDAGICVYGRFRSRNECWAYALEWLRPAHEPRAVGRAFVRTHGEVIEVDE